MLPLSRALSRPRLVPFRLSPCLQTAAAPQHGLGLLTSDLGDALGALHARRAALASFLDAFAREPLLDWAREAARAALTTPKAQQPAAGGGGEGGHPPAAAGEDGLAASRLAAARAKLSFANPVAVLIGELSASYGPGARSHAPHDWEALKDVVRGTHASVASQRKALRAAARGGGRREGGDAEACDGVAQQAAVLVEMATDTNILGRAWPGWRPWL